ncbi:hypothetical protein [Flavobacterium sp. LC2016-12]|uniref:hypothetical protein n=1 Tax=Flavobacterium sp. LC2016-12 TaxID=2783794 RepID=UPI00188D67B3|nr:hypothetical protein [Flavobacterium sp. LC2016-12]MBF4466894.1 hypothetical protein [Flavobacterium sp. LC2016-12]
MGATERVKEFIDYKGITKYKLCQSLGFSNKFLDNSSNMGTDKAGKILHHFPDLNPEWLLTGNGSMLKADILNEAPEIYKKTVKENLEEEMDYKELAEARKETIDSLKKIIAYLEVQIEESKKNKK